VTPFLVDVGFTVDAQHGGWFGEELNRTRREIITFARGAVSFGKLLPWVATLGEPVLVIRNSKDAVRRLAEPPLAQAVGYGGVERLWSRAVATDGKSVANAASPKTVKSSQNLRGPARRPDQRIRTC
jgi:hypothetical protein